MNLSHPTLDPGGQHGGLVQLTPGAMAAGVTANASSPSKRATQKGTLLSQDRLHDLLLRFLGLGKGLTQATGPLTHA
jgi:hypothetical protein